jgi:DNA-binding CsgD family transcriptional regulator
MALNRSARKAQKTTQIADRRRELLLLLRSGLTQAEAAARLGVSEATVSGDVAALRAALRQEAVKELGELVDLECAALDADEAALRAQLGAAADVRTVVLLYQQIGVIQDRRAKWRGFDTPPRPTAGVADLDAVLAALAGGGGV